jgi:DNA-binding MarR family transcriptional regulator
MPIASPPRRHPTTMAATESSEALADELLVAMGGIRRNARRRAGRPEELSRLTGAQLELVRLVRRRPGISVTQAAEDLGLVPNTVSTLVRQLSDLGYLDRHRDPTDRRVARLVLSDDIGRKVVAFRDRRVSLIAGAMDELSAADRRRLHVAIAVLARLQRTMEITQGGDVAEVRGR